MLPPPTLSFTIPSIQDDTVLQCRVYHPSCLAPASVSQITDWKKKAAIVAHPYAPLGGCYDDPVVNAIAATILKQGWVVATFNFRLICAYVHCRTSANILVLEALGRHKDGRPGSRSRSKMTISPFSDSSSTICICSPHLSLLQNSPFLILGVTT